MIFIADSFSFPVLLHLIDLFEHLFRDGELLAVTTYDLEDAAANQPYFMALGHSPAGGFAGNGRCVSGLWRWYIGLQSPDRLCRRLVDRRFLVAGDAVALGAARR